MMLGRADRLPIILITIANLDWFRSFPRSGLILKFSSGPRVDRLTRG